LIKIMGVLFLLLAALIVGSFMMVLADIDLVMKSDQVPRETLSISTRIALSVFQDASMAASDEITFPQVISLANSAFLGYGVATLVCAAYGVFLLLNSRKESTMEGES